MRLNSSAAVGLLIRLADSSVSTVVVRTHQTSTAHPRQQVKTRRTCQIPDLTEESRPNTATGAPMNTGTAYAALDIIFFSPHILFCARI